MGKTQLMLRYCYLHRADYNYVFWLEADSKTTALGSFRKLAVNLGIDSEKDETAVVLARDWLQQRTGWLLLLDNVDDFKALDFLPRTGGHMILTTREFVPREEATSISVDRMSEGEALALFLGSSSAVVRDSPQYDQARQIIAELDYMALAVNLARAYIEDM